MTVPERGVSTVLDVGMALLLITASVTMLAIYLTASDSEIDTHEPDRTAETIAASTISVSYSTERAEPDFHDDLTAGERTFDRVAHGSATGLLADAALANVAFEDEPLLAYGENFEEAVDASTRSVLVGSNHQFYATATWTPYDNASMTGRASAGVSPPADADISTTTMTVSSGIDPVDTDAMGTAYYHAYADSRDHDQARINASEEVARVIIAERFDPDASQHALETLGADRALTVYHYERMGEAVGVTFDPDDGHLSRHNGSALEANAELTDALAAWIAADLENTSVATDLETVPEEYPDNHDWEAQFQRTLTDAFATETVTITVQTWEP